MRWADGHWSTRLSAVLRLRSPSPPEARTWSSWGCPKHSWRIPGRAKTHVGAHEPRTLGHGQISLTLNRYSHVIPALGRAAAEQMDVVLAARFDSSATG